MCILCQIRHALTSFREWSVPDSWSLYIIIIRQGFCLRGDEHYSQTCDLQGANPQRVSTEIIIEIKQFNPGQMASHASSIESIGCTHRSIVFPSKNVLLD